MIYNKNKNNRVKVSINYRINNNNNSPNQWGIKNKIVDYQQIIL